MSEQHRTIPVETCLPTPFRVALRIVIVAACVTMLHVLKPLTIDDAIYHQYAAHIAENPGDPYGFALYNVSPANQVLAPLGFLYWFAGAIWLFGDHPATWKLALFPLALLLAATIHCLARRFTDAPAMPVVTMLMLCPVLLPGWNLMLDLPALAVGLGALVVYLEAADRRSLWLALLAGCILGIAMQTKYTAFILAPVCLWHGWLFGRTRVALAAVCVGVGIFVATEAWLAHLYGESHFLFHAATRSTSITHKLRLVLPLISTLGGAAGWLIPLALVSLGRSPQAVLVSMVVALAPFALIAALPESCQVLWRNQQGQSRFELAGALFGLLGLALCWLTIRVVRQALGSAERTTASPSRSAHDWFLLGWIALEVLGYFALSPFPAVRRIIGLVVPLTLIVARRAQAEERRRMPRWVTALAALLGLGFQAVDCWDAHAPVRAANEAVHWIQTHDADASIWCIGEHAFPFHGERAGMRVLKGGSDIRPGDWLVWTEAWVQAIGHPPTQEPPLHAFSFPDSLPLRVQKDYYNSGRPMRHHEGPRCTVYIARAQGR